MSTLTPDPDMVSTALADAAQSHITARLHQSVLDHLLYTSAPDSPFRHLLGDIFRNQLPHLWP